MTLRKIYESLGRSHYLPKVRLFVAIVLASIFFICIQNFSSTGQFLQKIRKSTIYAISAIVVKRNETFHLAEHFKNSRHIGEDLCYSMESFHEHIYKPKVQVQEIGVGKWPLIQKTPELEELHAGSDTLSTKTSDEPNMSVGSMFDTKRGAESSEIFRRNESSGNNDNVESSTLAAATNKLATYTASTTLAISVAATNAKPSQNKMESMSFSMNDDDDNFTGDLLETITEGATMKRGSEDLTKESSELSTTLLTDGLESNEQKPHGVMIATVSSVNSDSDLSRAINASSGDEQSPSSSPSPRLLKVVRYNMPEIHKTLAKDPELFEIWDLIKPAMSLFERQIMRILLKEFIKICRAHNITDYFIFSGTLLGSYRHHGLQPWDDDVDILTKFSNDSKMFDIFSKQLRGSERFEVVWINSRMKLFHKTQSVEIIGYRHRWPFIDVSFYYENSTHIWEVYKSSTLYHIVPKSIIFPLHPRPFETVMINSPRDAFAVLQLLFKEPACVALTWIHKTESSPPQGYFPFDCKRVASVYPFVHRKPVGSCTEESLWLNGTLLYSVSVEEPSYAISDPYKLELAEFQDETSTPTITDNTEDNNLNLKA